VAFVGDIPKSYLIVAFARPEQTINMVDFLLSRNQRVYLFVDGPKSTSTPNEMIRKHFLSYTNYPNFLAKYASEPNGPQRGVEAGLDWVFQREELVVILEDDSVISDKSLIYFDQMAGLISDKVVIVSSRRIIDDSNLTKCTSHSHVSRFALTNGWMTSKRFWMEHYNRPNTFSGLFFDKIQSENTLMNWAVRCFFLTGVARFELRLGNVGWDQKVVYTLLRDNLLSFVPNRTTVGNIGVDEIASNTKAKKHENPFLFRADLSQPDLNFSTESNCQAIVNKTFITLYGISTKNLFSPIKLLFELFFRKFSFSRSRNQTKASFF
jgi:hypothetical protein